MRPDSPVSETPETEVLDTATKEIESMDTAVPWSGTLGLEMKDLAPLRIAMGAAPEDIGSEMGSRLGSSRDRSVDSSYMREAASTADECGWTAAARSVLHACRSSNNWSYDRG